MCSRLFESFCAMLDSIPAKAIVRAVDAQRRMVEDDLASKRASPSEEASSILNFCDFILDAAQGNPSTLPALPVEHCASYRKVVCRLVDASELPASARERFDLVFTRALMGALSTA